MTCESVSHEFGQAFEIDHSEPRWCLTSPYLLADPRQWESEFERLRTAGVQGFAKGTASAPPTLGALEIFEEQARFSQMQFLRQTTRSYRTWSDFERVGMFRDVYISAFRLFCAELGEPISGDPNDPLVAMFLLVCDVAMNPAEFILLPPGQIEDIERAIHPGHRFVAVCKILKTLGPAFYKSIIGFTKAEYEVSIRTICAALGWASPLDIADEMARWTVSQPTIAQLRDEAQALSFRKRPVNTSIRAGLEIRIVVA